VDRLLIAAAIVIVAAAVAVVVRRRRPDAPTQPTGAAPTQLDRRDFDRPDADWLVVVFTSATCHTCADVVAKAVVMASDDVAVSDVEWPTHKDVHERYAVDAVPLLVIADRDGVVRRSFSGPVTATDLWAAVAAVRDEGSGTGSDDGADPPSA
jgi:Thioredoxin